MLKEPIVFEPKEDKIKVGEGVQINITGTFDDGTTGNITAIFNGSEAWHMNEVDEEYAEMDDFGYVAGIAPTGDSFVTAWVYMGIGEILYSEESHITVTE